ncbi:MAG TPA: Nif3-like dinuclear metal center hexameric protein [Acidobacteriota bacterium]|nr:Nif3-like dinuclear metal center hexameric protein [Acidobacteriota bacterium]
MVESRVLVDYLNQLLRLDEISDASQNGLQVQCPERIEKIGFAVDAALETFEEASRQGMQLLIVHHGLYWKDVQLAVDAHYQRLKVLFDAGIGLYAAHLPLDSHELYGNNSQLAELLGLIDVSPFGEYHGEIIGRLAHAADKLTRDELRERIDSAIGTKCLFLPFGKDRVEKVAIVSGGGADLLPQAIDERCDAFITGEHSHSAFHVAKEGGINLYFAGHYATETLGVKALQDLIANEFNVETGFIDFPTGL